MVSTVSSTQRELSFVLRATPFRERDQIVVLLTENKGKIHTIARNSIQSRRFGGCLDLFTASEVELDSRSIRVSEQTDEKLVGLQSALIRQSFQGLARNFDKLSAASAMNELILRTIPNHRPAPELFKLYSNCLVMLNEHENRNVILGVANAFVLKLTQWLGVQPAVTRCLSCEKNLVEIESDHVIGQVARGGWTCVACATESREHTLSKDVIFDAYQAILNPIRKTVFNASEREQLELLQYLEQHLLFHVQGLERKPVSSYQFLKSGI
jgi:DNA repair protein RecO